MPIVSRVLKFYRVQANGSARVREVHTDSFGNELTRQYSTLASQAAVEIDMNALDLTESLKERDVEEILQWVVGGNDPNTFDYTGRDIIKNKAEERVTRTFARSRGDDALPYAWWIDGLGTPRWNAITTRLAWDTARKDRVKARAATLNASYDACHETEPV